MPLPSGVIHSHYSMIYVINDLFLGGRVSRLLARMITVAPMEQSEARWSPKPTGDDKQFPPLPMNNVHECWHTTWMKPLQQFESNANSIRWTKITFKYQTLTRGREPSLNEPWSAEGETRRWGEKGVAGGGRQRKSVWLCLIVCVCVFFAYVSFGASPGLSALFPQRAKPIGSALWAYMVLARAGTDRQLLLNPDCFRFTGCERVWLRGCDPSEGGLSAPSSLTSLSLEGGRVLGGKGGGGLVVGGEGGLRASRDACFLVKRTKMESGPKNGTCCCLPLWVPTYHGTGGSI